MSDARSLLTRAAELRAAFDRSFAESRPLGPPPLVDFLAIRIGAEPYVLRLGDIAGLYPNRKITPVPGGGHALLGIAGFRGAIVPVYDLQLLLGHSAGGTPRWLVTVAVATAAFAVTEQQGLFRLPPEAIVSQQSDGAARPHVREFARTAESVRPVIDLFSVLDTVQQQVSTNLNRGER